MPTFCLLHGSGQGPEGWELLRHELEARRHPVLTPAFRLDKTDEGFFRDDDGRLRDTQSSVTVGLVYVFGGHI